MYTNGLAFAALKNDGSVVTWGSNVLGGDSQKYSAVSLNNVVNIGSARDNILKDVDKIHPIPQGFVAIKKDGSIVSWGATSDVEQINLNNLKGKVKDIISYVGTAGRSFAVLTTDNSVAFWGEKEENITDFRPFSEVANDLQNSVRKVVTNGTAFAAIKFDGSVFTWGGGGVGGKPLVRWDGSNARDVSVENQLSSGVVDIASCGYGFAATKSDGSIVTWGYATHGGDNSKVYNQLVGKVKKIYSSGNGFAALLIDGSVVCWGDDTDSGEIYTEEQETISVASQLKSDIVEIFSTTSALAALKSDGSVVTWGHYKYGADSRRVSEELQSGVIDIFTTLKAFAALKDDGSIVTWGDEDWGGDTSNVKSLLNSDVLSLSTPFADYAGPSQNLANSASSDLTESTSDLSVYSGNFGDYKFYNLDGNRYEIRNTLIKDEITGITTLKFLDKTINVIDDIKGVFDQVTGLNSASGKMFRLYNAAFARFPDSSGLNYWIEKFSSGENDERAVASSFLISTEFIARYGTQNSTEHYVNNLYKNVLGRDADLSGLLYWTEQINSGEETRYEVLLGFSESAENKSLFTEMTGFG
ncbi:hypothetical protein DNJ72_06510 [Prochlorococcus marinus XMU1403]|nr:hypothetical protein [Prochlorococcus marinus str. MU1403]PYE01049.1 hypothetical protein DNJ72_06510 [Prochlorococcus marinus XMU1403]